MFIQGLTDYKLKQLIYKTYQLDNLNYLPNHIMYKLFKLIIENIIVGKI